MIACGDVFIYRSEPISDRFTPSKSTAGFYIDAQVSCFKERRVDDSANSKGVVHGAAAGCFSERDLEACDGSGEVRDRSWLSFKFFRVGDQDGSFPGDVEAHHREWPARVENDRSGFGILINIVFGSAVDIAAGNGAAHQYNSVDKRNDGRVFSNGQRDIG